MAQAITRNFLEPGLKFGAAVTNGWGPLDLISLGLALIFGTAGLPHILVRFYTVPDAKTARVSVVWAMVIIGAVLHHDDVSRLRRGDDPHAGEYQLIGKPNDNMAAPLLAQALGGEVFFAFIQRGRLRHHPRGGRGSDDLREHSASRTIFTRTSFITEKSTRPGKKSASRGSPRLSSARSRFSSRSNCRRINVAFLVGLAFAVAASANLPVIVLSIFWRRFNTAGAVCGSGCGSRCQSSCSLFSALRSWGSTRRMFPLPSAISSRLHRFSR